MNNMKEFFKACGLVMVISFVYNFIKRINIETSTKLYDAEALKILEDDELYEKVYGRKKLSDKNR